ncbi:MAG: hypothetical protein Q8873_02105 [Bacillota bacterium]|nr:hypothetical protein [Bacillota bacterium]
MSTIIPKDATERFNYYFNQANSLDEKYNNKINKINKEAFNVDIGKTKEYKEAVNENAENADYLENKYVGNYAEGSNGYDNSMTEFAHRQVKQQETADNENAYQSTRAKYYNTWSEDKTNRIEAAKSKYANEFGNAIYNMQKANEESLLKKAKY